MSIGMFIEVTNSGSSIYSIFRKKMLITLQFFKKVLIKNMFEQMNEWGASGTPFVFIISYDLKSIQVFKTDDALRHGILINFPGFKNFQDFSDHLEINISLNPEPPTFEEYKKAFTLVQDEEKMGNSYLVNLTFPASVNPNTGLHDIFWQAAAPFKLLYDTHFTVFSPERFIRIEDNIVSTYPMKGTILSSIPDAENIILNDEKEKAEHITVVDLLRNDLNIIAEDIKVEQFRYIDEIKRSKPDSGKNGSDRDSILQVSSKITGKVSDSWQSRIGDILKSILPAGSITGAPKPKTCEIIAAVENYHRGFYTGVMGYFDGTVLDSAVMIRFIEKQEDSFVYKSGGGITIYSEAEKEYQELLDKIYVPVS